MGSRNLHLTKFDQIPLILRRFNVERNNRDAYEGDVFGVTEIEMSNCPALLTDTELSSCGQTTQHPLCCHWRAQWDRICFFF